MDSSVMSCDSDSAVIAFNKSGIIASIEQNSSILGVPREALIGKRFSQLLASPFEEQYSCFIEHAESNATYMNLLNQNCIVDVKYLGEHNEINATFNARLNMTLMGDGDQAMWVAFLTRLHERGATITTDQHGHILSSTNLSQVFGYNPAEIASRSITFLLPHLNLAHLTSASSSNDAGHTTAIQSCLARHKNGSLLNISIHTKSVKIREFEIYSNFVQRLDPNMEAILTVDHSGFIMGANHIVFPLFGYLKDELIGHRLDDFFPKKRGIFCAAGNMQSNTAAGMDMTSPRNSFSSVMDIEWIGEDLRDEGRLTSTKRRRLNSSNSAAVPSSFCTYPLHTTDNHVTSSMVSPHHTSGSAHLHKETIEHHLRHKDGNLIPVNITKIPLFPSSSKQQQQQDVSSTSSPMKITGYSVRISRKDLDYWQTEKSIAGFRFMETLGRGSSGKVKRAVNEISNQEVAVKILTKVPSNAEDNSFKFAMRESQILAKLSHPNIVKLHKVIETPEKMNIIMEHIRGVNLMAFIEGQPSKHLSETDAKRIFVQIVSALNYCHSLNICHRDVKPKNIMIDPHGNAKLIDFGLSNWIARDGHFLTTFCGTPAFASPEQILGKPYRGPEVDVWSVGIVLYTMLTGKFPFNSVFELLQGKYPLPSSIEHSPVAGGISNEAQDLIQKMLQMQPEKRLTTNEILEHPWISGISSISAPAGVSNFLNAFSQTTS